jgi:hypothetical protein
VTSCFKDVTFSVAVCAVVPDLLSHARSELAVGHLELATLTPSALFQLTRLRAPPVTNVNSGKIQVNEKKKQFPQAQNSLNYNSVFKTELGGFLSVTPLYEHNLLKTTLSQTIFAFLHIFLESFLCNYGKLYSCYGENELCYTIFYYAEFILAYINFLVYEN